MGILVSGCLSIHDPIIFVFRPGEKHTQRDNAPQYTCHASGVCTLYVYTFGILLFLHKQWFAPSLLTPCCASSGVPQEPHSGAPAAGKDSGLRGCRPLFLRFLISSRCVVRFSSSGIPLNNQSPVVSVFGDCLLVRIAISHRPAML